MGAGPAGPGGVARPKSLLRFAQYYDQAALLGWVLFTSVPSQGVLALPRYLLVGYFVLGLVIHSRHTLGGFVRGWPSLVLPLMCLVSTIWAPSSSDAIRLGVFMFLTAAVAIYAGTRMSGRDILLCYFLGEIFGAVLTVLHPTPDGGGAWTGPFSQKNFLAAHMFIMYACGFPLLFDPSANKLLRLLAAIFVPLGAVIILLAHSATTLLLLVGSTSALIAHVFVWQPATRIPMARTFLVLVIVVMGLIITTVLFGFTQFNAESSLLSALGKDSTLIGRTFMWQIAYRIMDQHPFTGLGAVGFWRPELGAANEITRYFFYEHYTKFSFHNSYLENGVQFGYPGYYFTFFLAAWGCWGAFRVWTRNQTLHNAIFMVLALMVVVRSNAETDLAAELAPTAILMFIGALRRDAPTTVQPPAPEPLLETGLPPGDPRHGRLYPRSPPLRR
ncbi:MAG TPA: O-antigen ligase family protein [Candidatus Polarisedimenticolia bacterium]|nr:O-antigen ligase family protein [Candidatus Polarisedimenticolia bacterium]